MNSRRRIDLASVAPGIGLVVLATLACLSPVHNDTWWHLASGREMAQIGGFADVDRFSFTVTGYPLVNHQWLAQRAFYGLWLLGGLPLLTAFCGALITGGWVLCWRLTRGPVPDRLLLTGAAVAASTMVWSVRPQAFTIALLPLVVTLLVKERLWPIPIVVVVWANLHGGVLLGLLAIGMFAAVHAVGELGRAWRLVATLAVSTASTLATPLGWRYWPEIFASLQRSQVNGLQEWRPPAGPPDHLLFWAAVVLLPVLAFRRWRTLTSMADRGIVATAMLLLPTAVRGLRNIAAFMMMAAPALARLLFGKPLTTTTPPVGGRLSWPVAAAALAGAVVVALAWSGPWPRLGWTPMSEDDATAIRECRAPIYNTYADGGPIIWFVPSQPVMVDSRQDHYPADLIADATAIEHGHADPGALFGRLGIQCAVLRPDSAPAEKLLAAGWHQRHRSIGWIVLEAPQNRDNVSDRTPR